MLKKPEEIEQLNENKFRYKYEGPYKVVQVWENGLTYLLKGGNGRREVRAYQTQLHK